MNYKKQLILLSIYTFFYTFSWQCIARSQTVVIGIDFNGVLIKKYAPKTFGFIPGILDILTTLKGHGYPIFIVSNSEGRKLKRIFEQYPQELKVIDDIYAPAKEHGLKKSHNDFFLSLRKWLSDRGFAHATMLLFDDQQRYVDNANQLSKETITYADTVLPINIEAFLFTSPEQMRQILQDKGLYNLHGHHSNLSVIYATET